MAKRFGRQQKRKMREQINNLESEVRQLIAIGARNREIVKNTAHVLGRYFITLPPETVEVRRLDQLTPGWRMLVSSADRYGIGFNHPDAISPGYFLEIILPVIRGDVRHELGQHMHVQFEYNGRRVGCAIREESLKLMPQETAIQEISRAMAAQMTGSMRAAH